MEYLYFADYRNKLDDENMLVIHVAGNENYMEDVKYKAFVDGKESDVTMVTRNTIRAKFCYVSRNIHFTNEFQFLIPVTPDFKKAELIIELGEKCKNTKKSIIVKGRRFRKNLAFVPGAIDTIKKEKNGTRVIGWSASKDKVDIKVLHKGTMIPGNGGIIRPFRKDITDYYLDGELTYAAGFELVLDENQYDKVSIVCESGSRKTLHKVNLKNFGSKKNRIADAFRRADIYRKRYGFVIMVQKIFQKLLGTSVYDYDKYIKNVQADEATLKEQREAKFKKTPLFSIVVPVYRPKKEFFEDMIMSVLNQTYSNWELCIADGSGKGFEMDLTCSKLLNSDSRIKYVKLSENLGISGNTNAAMDLVTGDYIVLGDHDDIIRPDALYECAALINEKDDVEVIYTDEDKYDYAKKKRIQPNFKPDFNLYFLRGGNYICHLFVFSKEISKKVGRFKSEYDGAQDFDMILRCVEVAKKVYHIPKILYSWRCHENSTANNPESKKYAYIAGKAAVKAHLERLNIPAEVSIDDKHPGIYFVKYDLTQKPLVSVIIPNMNHVEDLDKCIRSLEKQTYGNLEIIIVENNSNGDTFKYYDSITTEFDNIKIAVYDKKGFNYSELNNFGVQHSKGEFLLLLNNDIEMTDEECIDKMVRYLLQPDVGIVGAKLLYADNNIQHAGVVVGLGGVAGHCFVGYERDYEGYQAYTIVSREYSAVTAACMMVKKSAYEAVGGFSKELAVAFNDVDFCLKVGEKQLKIIYAADVCAYHYESKSRGYEDTPEKINRFQEECNYFINKWSGFLKDGDPNYNPNLSLTKHDFSLREI